MDNSIDRVYKHLESTILPKVSYSFDSDVYDEPTLNNIVDIIYSNLSISLDEKISKNYIKNRLSGYRINQKKLENLQKIPEIIQRSDEWFSTRKKLITSSDFGQALNKGKFGSQKDFIMKKVNSIIENKNVYLQSDNPALKWGVMYEQVATDIYMKRNNVIVYEFGLMIHPDKKIIGASPDGINELGVMLEIKCPFKRKIDGSVPEQYWMQIQGQLEVCNLNECDYVECKLIEYKNEKQFLEDTFTDGILSNDFTEKGCIIEYKDNSITKYLYNDINITALEVINWKKDIISKFDFTVEYSIKFWKLKEYHCKRVYRECDFFNKNIHNLEFIWDKIEFFSKNKDEYIKKVLNNKKKRVFEFKEFDNQIILNGYAFKEDD